MERAELIIKVGPKPTKQIIQLSWLSAVVTFTAMFISLSLSLSLSLSAFQQCMHMYHKLLWVFLLLIAHMLNCSQVVMSPHAQAEEFISSYTKLMQDDSDINNFQKVLEMKVM